MPVYNAQPGRISSVDVARPGQITSVGNSNGSQTTNFLNTGNAAVASTDDFLAKYKALLAGINKTPAPVYAPKLDFAAINSQARQSAENAVNPYYTKTLNDFLTQQSAQRQQQQTQTETNIKNIGDTLKQTQEDIATSTQRTTEDVAKNQAEVDQTADEFQTDTGSAFDVSRRAEAAAVAKAGLTGGLGAQQKEASQTSRNTAEKRQTGKFDEAKEKQELFKARTFEDLTKTGTRAVTSAEKSTKQAKFDLDTYIQNQGFQETNKRNETETQRQNAIYDKQEEQRKLLTQQFIAKIANPAKRQAAQVAYG